MFRNLIQFWKGRDFLKTVFEEFKEMLDDSCRMFNSVCRKLIDNQEEEGLEEKIYAMDKRVNGLEKDIRKRIVEHLILQPSVELSTSLLLMSVVKDAERLGDYSKNLFEVSGILKKPIDKETYFRFFGNSRQDLEELFNITKEAFIQSDQKQSARAWDYEVKLVKNCDAIIAKLAESDSLPVNTAVAFTLIARYFKRLTAHLSNIATSIIVPLNEIDYYRQKKKKIT